MKPLSLLLLMLGIVTQTVAQNNTVIHVSGYVVEGETKSPLTAATIILNKLEDVTAKNIAYTNQHGGFYFDNIMHAAYELTVAVMGYQTLKKQIIINASSPNFQIDTIFLFRSAISLHEVEIISIKPAVRFKKDTVEMIADSFKVKPHAMLQDLVSKLPGLLVSADGTITYNGQPIKAVWLNGKPFFGSDVLIALQHFSTEMIEKIQVIDQASEEIKFNTTQRDKILNLIVRKNQMNSWTGQLMAAGGMDGKYAGQMVLSRVLKRSQLSILGSLDNINGYHIAQPVLGSPGIQKTLKTGIDYSGYLSKNWNVSVSYIHDDNKTGNSTTADGKNILTAGEMVYQQKGNNEEDSKGNMISFRVALENDSLQTLIVRAGIYGIDKLNTSYTNYQAEDDSDYIINSNNASGKLDDNSIRGNIMVNWERKLNQSGRKVGVGMNSGIYKSNQAVYSKSDNYFALSDGTIMQDSLNQKMAKSAPAKEITLTGVFTEPLGKRQFLDLLYQFSYAEIRLNRATHGYNYLHHEYDLFIDSLSNSSRTRITNNAVGAKWRLVNEKWNIETGLLFQSARYIYRSMPVKMEFSRQYNDVLGNLGVSYYVNANNTLRFNYNNQVALPAAIFLQPVTDNTNPLYITKGNPDIKRGYTFNGSVSYEHVNPHNGATFSGGLNATFLKNKVTMSVLYDSIGRQISQPVNVNGEYNLVSNLNKRWVMAKEMALQLGSNIIYSRVPTVIGQEKQYSYAFTAGPGLQFNYNCRDLLDLTLRSSMDYNNLWYNVKDRGSTKYYKYNAGIDVNFRLPAHVNIGANLEYAAFTGQAAGANTTACMLSSYISKDLFKSRKGLIKLQAFDLLKQNQSFTRIVTPLYMESTTNTVMQRFFLLSFTWFLRPAEE